MSLRRCQFVFFVLVLAASAAAQNAPSSDAEPVVIRSNTTDPDQPSFTLTKRVSEVRLIFTATDRHGHFVTHLRPEDVALTDDHKPPATIISFGRETDMPLDIGLVIDTSGSIRQSWTFEQQAAIGFLRRVLRPNYDFAFEIGFNSTVHTSETATSDLAKLQRGLQRLRPGGGTALYDAVIAACHIHQRPHGEVPRRRMIILLTDGEDNQSRATLEDAIEQAKRAEVTIYAISTNDSSWVMRGDKILDRLASETGGRVFFPSRLKDLSHSFNQIENELRSQYVIAYRPAEFRPDGHYRKIQLAARNPHVLTRARAGYYSPVE